MTIRCVVACTNASGSPDFVAIQLECTKKQYDEGTHYEWAKEWAKSEDYERPMVVFDEHDGPAWLFQHVVPTATLVIPRK